MTKFQQAIINKFHNLVKDHEMDCTHTYFTQSKRNYDVYSVIYSSIIIPFISDLTGLNKSSIRQYIAAQQFFFFLSDNPNIDIKVSLYVSEHFVSIDFKESVDIVFEPDNPVFLHIVITRDDKVKMTDCHNISLLDSTSFEAAYTTLLQETKNIVDPELLSFKKILELYNKNTFDVLNEKMQSHQIKAISQSEFCAVYLNNPDIEQNYETCMRLPEQTFMSFLKDIFPSSFYSKLRSILSVCLFQEKLCKRTINWRKQGDFNLMFPNVSKYSELNIVYQIIFSIMPCDNYPCTINVYDNGTFSFCYSKGDDLIELIDLDAIYDYIKEGFISHIEKTLDINRKDIKTSHLKLYEMILM